MNITIGYIIIGIGMIFMLFGVIGLLQTKKDFYYRIMISCKIDTVGLLTICLGIAIRHGISFFTGKVIIIVIILLILNPLVVHLIVRSANRSGFGPVNDDRGPGI